jgi:hypothetical protein
MPPSHLLQTAVEAIATTAGREIIRNPKVAID